MTDRLTLRLVMCLLLWMFCRSSCLTWLLGTLVLLLLIMSLSFGCCVRVGLR